MPKVIPVSNDMEHKVAVAAITDEEFLSHLVPMLGGSRYDVELFRSPAVAVIVKWCRDYHGKYGKPPGKSIQDIFDGESAKPRANPERMEQVGELLASLSEKFEGETVNNPQHLLDEAERYLRERAIDLVREELGDLRMAGQLDKAEAAIADYRRPARAVSEGINPLTDADVVREAFEKASEPIVTLPGAAGEFVNPHLIREGFISLMGPEKRGKTFGLIDLSVRALQSRRNVAFLAVGDMSLHQMVKRIHVRLAGRNDRACFCQTYYAPVMDCVLNQDGTCKRDGRACDCRLPETTEKRNIQNIQMEDYIDTAPDGYLPCTACRREEESDWKGAVWWEKREAVKPLTWREGMKEAEGLVQRARGRSMKLAAYPNETVTVPDIERQLDAWERYEEFVPDVIVVDYADILAPIDGKRDYRQQQNQTWMALRRLSQERRCLVLTATQSDAASYSAYTLTMDNFSEDKRKFSHVTGMIGLNQMPYEKRMGLFRLSWILLREGVYDQSYCVTLLQDLRRGRWMLDSF